MEECDIVEPMKPLQSFPPIGSEQSEILILGSMPGVESLRIQQYYGNKRNQFWKILFTLYNVPFTENYEERKQFLLQKKIALWDVFLNCEREGSLDSAIRNEVPNGIPAFLADHKNIRRIFCNGGKAFKSFTKTFPQLSSEYDITLLPSTSPAYTVKFEEKLAKWRVILN